MSQKCVTCSTPCRGKQCKACYYKKGKDQAKNDTFTLKDILSSQTVHLDESGIQTNDTGTVFSNPFFQEGNLVDIEYLATASDINIASPGSDEVQAERFSLIDLITKVVEKQTAPLRKQINDLESANMSLKDEVEALKAEKEVLTAGNSNAATSENIETALAPYKEALLKIAPIEQSLQNHQRYLDHDDAKKREMNVIITGVKESTGGENDIEKVNQILLAADCGDVVPVKVARIGKRVEDETRSRPLLIVTDSPTTRKKILTKKANLKKHVEGSFKSIYIKPDEPIAIRKEWKRLRDAMKKEKEAPTNQGVVIKIDYKTRELLRDDTVIDKFRPPFQQRGPNH